MPAAAAALTFEKDVRPILKAHCFHCHGEEGETKAGSMCGWRVSSSKAAKRPGHRSG
jgi:cytochrome c553